MAPADSPKTSPRRDSGIAARGCDVCRVTSAARTCRTVATRAWETPTTTRDTDSRLSKELRGVAVARASRERTTARALSRQAQTQTRVAGKRARRRQRRRGRKALSSEEGLAGATLAVATG
jgi:hypothetical protein